MKADLIIDVSNKLTEAWIAVKITGGSGDNFYEAVPDLYNDSSPACMRNVLEHLQMKSESYTFFVLESIAGGLYEELKYAGLI